MKVNMINAKKHFSNISHMKLGNIRKNSQNKTPVYNNINNNIDSDSLSNHDLNEISYGNIIDKVMGNNEIEEKYLNNKLKKSFLKSKSNTNVKNNHTNTKKSNLKLNSNFSNQKEGIEILKNNYLNVNNINNNNNDNKLLLSPCSGKSISVKSNSPKEIHFNFDKLNNKNKEKLKKSKFKNVNNLDEKEEDENSLKKDNKINNYNNIILYNVTKNKIINSKKKVTFFIENEKTNSNVKKSNQQSQLEKFEITLIGIKKSKFCCF